MRAFDVEEDAIILAIEVSLLLRTKSSSLATFTPICSINADKFLKASAYPGKSVSGQILSL